MKDPRKPTPNKQYSIADLVLSAFGVLVKTAILVIMDSSILQFLLKLYECSNQRAYLSSSHFRNFQNKDKICDQLGSRELVDYDREIAKVVIEKAGSQLLSSDTESISLSEPERKVLQKIAINDTGIIPSQIKVTFKGKQLSALEREKIITKLYEQELVSIITKKRRNKCEVWLTEQGKKCLSQVNEYFLLWNEDAPKPKPKPDDNEILQTIIQLDRELGTNNYLPIFHLRKSWQPPLSREELDQAIYRLQRQDKIEMSTLAEVQAYTDPEIAAGIPQPVGGPLFYIIVNDAALTAQTTI